MAKIYQFYDYTYPVYKAPFCQYGRLSENLPILSIKSRNGQQHGASSTTTMKPTTLKYTSIKIVIYQKPTVLKMSANDSPEIKQEGPEGPGTLT